jgi:nitrous oxidase accessory protein
MRHQRFLWTLLLLLTLLPTTLTAWLVLPARAATLRVPQDYPTIQAAINAAHTGDTIQVDGDTYPENVIVNATVTIIGEDATTTIVDGGENDMVFNIQADNVELHNLTICNGGRRYSGVTIYDPYDALTIRNTRIIDNAVGVVISGDSITSVDDVTIEDSIFINNQMYGIDAKYSSTTIIRNNQISDSAYGVELSDSSSSHVINNTIFDTSYGIYVPYSNNNNISTNTLTSNSWNIYLTYSNSNIIGNNDVSDGSVGIQIMRSQGNTVLNNTASSSSYGIYLGYCGANTVSGNTASLNDWGIDLYNTTASTIKENTIKDNTWGFYVVENSKGNYFYHNNIINNVKQAFQDLTSGQNTWRTPTTPYEGNYWSDYKGEDTDGDGTGDTYLPWQGVDWHPLMTPWGPYSDIAIISVTTSTAKAYVGEIVNITVTAENQGSATETFNVTAKYENITYGILETVGTQEVTDLPADETIILTFTWNTTDVQPCINYTIKAEASLVPNEIDTSDNTFIDGKVKVKIVADINGDGIVDIEDLSIVAISYGYFEGEPGYNPEADLIKDGMVDIGDISLVCMNYGKTC